MLQNLSDLSGQDGNPVPPVTETVPAAQPGTPQAPAENQPQYLTRDEFEQEKAKIISQAQSIMGKSEKRVLAKVEELKSIGIQATPQQAEAMLALEDKSAQPGKPPEVPPPAAPPVAPISSDPQLNTALAWAKAAGLEQPNDIELEAYRLMVEGGAQLTSEDPEAKEIDRSNPTAFLASIQSAVAKAKVRRAKEGIPSGARAPALVGGAPSNKPIHEDMSASETLDYAFSQLLPK